MPFISVRDIQIYYEISGKGPRLLYISGTGDRAKAMARRIRTGNVHLNGAPVNQQAPFGGYKMSGIGRENAHHAIEYYSQVKSVYVELGDVEAGY